MPVSIMEPASFLFLNERLHVQGTDLGGILVHNIADVEIIVETVHGMGNT
jgi:hypothetical protein